MSATLDTVWVDACYVEDIPRLGAQRFVIGETQIAVFRADGDKVFAIEDKCPHKKGPLSQGIVHANCVTCPLHNWVINLSSGEAEGADEGSVTTFPVEVAVDGTISVEVPNTLFSKAAA